MQRTAKGKFSPQFPHKYRGNPREIIFRSSWEYRVMKWLDMNSKVLWWSSEPFSIPYVSPIDGRSHNYWPDFMFCIETKDGTKKQVMVEVKPEEQTRPPTPQQRKTKAYMNKVTTWGKNQAKWKAAKYLCENKGWDFQVWTEKTLNPS